MIRLIDIWLYVFTNIYTQSKHVCIQHDTLNRLEDA